MPVSKLTIENFLDLAKKHPVLDVRSPGEFAHAHIPGAHSLPLFSDEERKAVGTAYKQESQQKAIKIGLDFFGKKMVKMVEDAETITGNQASDRIVLVHCWRGGMRSAGVAWLLDLYGFKVYTLTGGYKAYRRWALQQFEKNYPFQLIGGYTGTAKTLLLKELQHKNEPVIDLESLAGHKGSAFGNLDFQPQPSQEMFENRLALLLTQAEEAPKPIWVEDECQRMGLVNIPGAIFKTMHQSPLFFLDVPFEERLKQIVNEYGTAKAEQLSAAIQRIKKRLGPLDTKNALEFLANNNITECFRILLHYYDKTYNKALSTRDQIKQPVVKLSFDSIHPGKYANFILSIQGILK